MRQGIVSVSLDSGLFRHYTEVMVPTENEVLHHFDSRRRDFAPYGFTCEIWEPRQMPRPDRHDEIEINFGVKLSTAAGAVIAAASAEANFDVTVRWTGKKEEAPPKSQP